MKKSLLVILVLMLLSINAPGANAREIRAVATFSVIGDLVEQVGGNRVRVDSIVPLGGDPHTWEATPREARNLAAADILFYNGLGLEIWVDRLIENTARQDLPVVVLSEGLTPLAGPKFTAHSHEQGDPHFWLDVQHAMTYVERIRDALIDVDPNNRDYYQANAAEYLQELVELDQWITKQIQTIPAENRQIITYHDAFGYLANRYGLTISGFLVTNPDREPSAREMGEIIGRLQEFARPVIFIEPQLDSSARYAQAIAQEVGGDVAYLYSDSLSQEVSTYKAMMEHNGKTLVEALK